MAFAAEQPTARTDPRHSMTAHDEKNLLSNKRIPRKERLIVALDVPTHEQAYWLVGTLGDAVEFYKIGLELLLAGDYNSLVDELIARGKKVFVDLKLFDVPETVQAAVRQLNKRATFVTVHGNESIMRAACEVKNDVGILAVTFLTSLDDDDLRDLGVPENISVMDVVESRTRRALKIGCDGVISSALEAPGLRREFGTKFLIVSPGIRPQGMGVLREDQKRVVSPRQAFLNGADYIVVGRPIRDSSDPKAMAIEIQNMITDLFPK